VRKGKKKDDVIGDRCQDVQSAERIERGHRQVLDESVLGDVAVGETEGFESAVRPKKETLKGMDGVFVVAMVDDFQVSKKRGSKVIEKITKVAAYSQREGREVWE
jgi:hypothetical protein